jgi:hypothetical protein
LKKCAGFFTATGGGAISAIIQPSLTLASMFRFRRAEGIQTSTGLTPHIGWSAGCESRKTEGKVPKMEYRKLPLSCECGGEPKSISAVGFSSLHDLVIRWRCPRCRKNLSVIIPLSDCWRECPGVSPHAPKSNATLTVDSPDDQQFLRSIGVRYADE